MPALPTLPRTASSTSWRAPRCLALGACLALWAGACGPIRETSSDADVPPDAAVTVDAPPPPDAASAAARHELVSGAAHLQSATYRLDVQVGHSFQPTSAVGTGYRLEGSAVVRP